MELTASQRKAFQLGAVALVLAAVAIFVVTGWVAALPMFAGGLAIMVLASQAAEPSSMPHQTEPGAIVDAPPESPGWPNELP